VNPLPSLLSAIGIKLNTVAKHLSTVGDNLERRAIANTRVDRGRRSAWELEKPANPLGFGQWQWVETKPTFADKAHWGPPFSEEPVRSSWRKSLGLFILKWGSGSQMGDEWMYNRSRWKAKMEIPVWRLSWMDFPQGIDSKFRFILVAAKRARQLQSGARPFIQTRSKRATRIAQLEVKAGLVPFLVEERDKLDLPREDRTRSTKSDKAHRDLRG
jgi:DNA-directed RNA polymerase subunit omega